MKSIFADVTLLDRYSKTYESKDVELKSATIIFCGILSTVGVDRFVQVHAGTLKLADLTDNLTGSQDRSDHGKFGRAGDHVRHGGDPAQQGQQGWQQGRGSASGALALIERLRRGLPLARPGKGAAAAEEGPWEEDADGAHHRHSEWPVGPLHRLDGRLQPDASRRMPPGDRFARGDVHRDEGERGRGMVGRVPRRAGGLADLGNGFEQLKSCTHLGQVAWDHTDLRIAAAEPPLSRSVEVEEADVETNVETDVEANVEAEVRRARSRGRSSPFAKPPADWAGRRSGGFFFLTVLLAITSYHTNKTRLAEAPFGLVGDDKGPGSEPPPRNRIGITTAFMPSRRRSPAAPGKPSFPYFKADYLPRRREQFLSRANGLSTSITP
ncbi:hypothetical protein THAOC_19766 [Thalassiosira oceanica]|uniref:Uncharacterized protein n=1 Tax=Thalassiosira oceanica TaxID=159749 RepID=K0S525_THAOC|nr:hypothetical protein THAOC_19766 [Thalassiosira oceanica]|eukprot:EJK59959.1 hypothetical protein THAOC_19766 [Thalassiosira oceanica]